MRRLGRQLHLAPRLRDIYSKGASVGHAIDVERAGVRRNEVEADADSLDRLAGRRGDRESIPSILCQARVGLRSALRPRPT